MGRREQEKREVKLRTRTRGAATVVGVLAGSIGVLLLLTRSESVAPSESMSVAGESNGEKTRERPSGVERTAETQPRPERLPVESPSVTVRGRVVLDRSGAGVGGVRVVMRVVPEGRRSEVRDLPLGETDGSGHLQCSADVLRERIDFRVTATKPGYVEWRRVWTGWDVQDEIDFGEARLVSGTTVSGRVVDGGNQNPVAGVRVAFVDQSGGITYSQPSDGAGSYRTRTGLLPGRYTVRALAEGAWLQVMRPPSVIVSREQSVHDVVVAPIEGLLRGQVIEATTGAGIRDVTISVGERPFTLATRSGSQGEFVMHARPEWLEDTRVQIIVDGYSPVATNLSWGQVVRDGGRIELLPDPLVWLFVRDAESRTPLADFEVGIPYGMSGHGVLDRGIGNPETVDGQSSGRRGVMAPSTACIVRVSRSGYIPAHLILSADREATRARSYDVYLGRTTALECHVVDAAGRDIARCSIQVLTGVISESGPVDPAQVVRENAPFPIVGGSAADLETACAHLALVIDESSTDEEGRASVRAHQGAKLRVRDSDARESIVAITDADLATGSVEVVLSTRSTGGVVTPRSWVDEAIAKGARPHVVFRRNTAGAQVLADVALQDLSALAVKIDDTGQFVCPGDARELTAAVTWRVVSGSGRVSVFQREVESSIGLDGALRIDMADSLLGESRGTLLGRALAEIRLDALPPMMGQIVGWSDDRGRYSLLAPGGRYALSARIRDGAWVVLDDSHRVPPGGRSGDLVWSLDGTDASGPGKHR